MSDFDWIHVVMFMVICKCIYTFTFSEPSLRI
jgi:hypothetical protein